MSIWLSVLQRIAFTVLAVGLLSATFARYAPGFGSDEDQLDTRRDAASLARLRARAQADSNVLSFYVLSLRGYLQGDMGTSRSLNRPVRDLLRERVRPTAVAALAGLCAAWLLGLAKAVIGLFHDSAVFRVSAGAGLSLLQSLPAAVIALLLVLFGGRGALLGGAALALILAPRISIYSGNILEQAYRSTHILMARARGLSRARILVRHVMPVSLPQLLAFAAVSVSLALSALIPVEVILDIPGIGQLAWQAALARDMSVLLAITMALSLCIVVSHACAELIVRASSLAGDGE